MTLVEALKDYHLRVEYRNRWVVWHKIDCCFVVYEHPYRARRNKILITTLDEKEAVRILIGE